MSDTTVSVIVPVYNAAATIDETLRSVSGQTHRNLEVIVVDDGSSDASTAIVSEHVARDPRIRLHVQLNAGVAGARNTGAARASSDFIAPIDADDLWAPEKLERQLEVFAARDVQCGLVYSWFALIDAESRIFLKPRGPMHEGSVLRDLAYSNFIGNGSSALIRRSVFEECGGYDTSLRARGGQGCEDWKLYCQIATRYDLGVVPAYMTGYRVLRDNMSSDVAQMLRSRDLVTSDLLPFHPELARPFRKGCNRMSRFLLHRALRERRFQDARTVLASMVRTDPLYCAAAIAALPLKILSYLRPDRESRQRELFS